MTMEFKFIAECFLGDFFTVFDSSPPLKKITCLPPVCHGKYNKMVRGLTHRNKPRYIRPRTLSKQYR